MTPVIPAPFASRIAKLRRTMAESGADLSLCDHGELIGWLTGYMGSETMYRAVLVPADGPPWIVLRELDAPQVPKQGWLQDVIGFDDWHDPFTCVARSIVDRNYGEARVLTDNASYSFTAFAAMRLSEELPRCKFIYRPGLSDRLRAVKDDSEIESMRRASQIADQTMEILRSEMGPGATPRQAGAIAAASYLRLGADDGQVGRICKGAGGTGFLHAELDDTSLGDGDVLHVELVPKVKHYSARLMRPIAIGSVQPETKRITDILIEYQDRQIAAMASGRAAVEIDAILRDGLIGKGLRRTYENVTGYMLGLYGRTPRSSDFSHVFLPTSNWLLEAGMVFHMYSSADGIGISETVLVTDAGGVRLTNSPRGVCVSGS